MGTRDAVGKRAEEHGLGEPDLAIPQPHTRVGCQDPPRLGNYRVVVGQGATSSVMGA